MPDTKQVLRDARERVAPPTDVMRSLERRRLREAQHKRVAAGVMGIVVALVGLGGWFAVQRDASPHPGDRSPAVDAERFGVFAPFAGRILFRNDCITRVCPSTGSEDQEIWGIDPAATDPKPTKLPGELGTPVGWSSDGTELLVIQTQGGSRDGGLILRHADGTETSLLGPIPRKEEGLLNAAISPDGSRVAYTSLAEGGGSALFAIDVATGRTTLLVEPSMLDVYQPTFSPDGTQIAYMDGGGDHDHSVWVVNADGTDPHMIVKNEVTWGGDGGHVFGLAWSPTGDRIALGLRQLPVAAIYTFAPDGSGFTLLIPDAVEPSWSPDGAHIAFESNVMHPCPDNPDACFSEDLTRGLGIADADGSHAHTLGVGGSGPWHPA